VSVFERDAGKFWKVLVLQLEPKAPSIEGDGAKHVADLVPNAVESPHMMWGLLL
jgi:hypothetical protein